MRMTNDMYPYTLDIIPCDKPAGYFNWAIRKNGKLVQRSDRAQPTEDAARKRGLAEIERQFATAHSGR
jgi:hypothetical protein